MRALWHRDDARTCCARPPFATSALGYTPGTLVSRQFENSLPGNTMHLQLLPISTNWKGISYDSILVISNRLMKIVLHEPA